MAPRRLLGAAVLLSGAALRSAATAAGDVPFAGDEDVRRAFEGFKARYGRRYGTAAEERKALHAFAESYRLVESENARGLPYELRLNEFADTSAEEFASTRLGLSLPDSTSAWKGLPHLGTDRYSGAALPESVDWVAKGAVTDPKNQKSCGSCWSFSSTGSLEGAWQIATGHLVSLSEQQLIDCSKKNSGCGGGIMEKAFEYLEDRAVCTESSYPYEEKASVCRESSCTVAIPRGGVTGYRDVPADDEHALMEAVSRQPISVAIEADQKAFQLYSRGILTKTCGSKVDHGVLLVGYGTDGGVPYWKIKNSWGAAWGEDGYVRIERHNQTGPGMCGIKTQSSYPVVQGSPAPSPSPGPSPAPVPTPSPTPQPPSPPSPAPGGSHYGPRPCLDDEIEASLPDLGGYACAPKCSASGSCPNDLPGSAFALPECMLASSTSGERYCGLECIPEMDSACPAGAKCRRTDDDSAVGICVYTGTEVLSASTLALVPSRAAKELVV